VTWTEFSSDPSKLQLVEARTHQMTELANLCNIPQYLVGAPVTGMTYSNAQSARQDLYQFAAKPVIDCLGETLSAYALPRGREVRLDTSEYISEGDDSSTMSSPDTSEMSNS
jgi:phage portal protein BeeE